MQTLDSTIQYLQRNERRYITELEIRDHRCRLLEAQVNNKREVRPPSPPAPQSCRRPVPPRLNRNPGFEPAPSENPRIL